jgi:hypothetical protein
VSERDPIVTALLVESAEHRNRFEPRIAGHDVSPVAGTAADVSLPLAIMMALVVPGLAVQPHVLAHVRDRYSVCPIDPSGAECENREALLMLSGLGHTRIALPLWQIVCLDAGADTGAATRRGVTDSLLDEARGAEVVDLDAVCSGLTAAAFSPSRASTC